MKLNSMFSQESAEKLFLNNKNIFLNHLKKYEEREREVNTNRVILDAVFSEKYSKCIILQAIKNQSIFINEEDEIVKKILLIIPSVFDDEIDYLSIYNHPSIYIPECPELPQIRCPIYTEEAALKLYKDNLKEWENEINSIYFEIKNSISLENQKILYHELELSTIQSIMYGDINLTPLDNIRTYLPHELKSYIKYKVLN